MCKQVEGNVMNIPVRDPTDRERCESPPNSPISQNLSHSGHQPQNYKNVNVHHMTANWRTSNGP